VDLNVWWEMARDLKMPRDSAVRGLADNYVGYRMITMGIKYHGH
jgi:hypothetical protein